MLIQFSVENYASFKEKTVLSLEPSVDEMHPENIHQISTYRALKSIAVYGANASGKTSLFKAMVSAILIIKSSNLMQVGQKLPVFPFKFDRKSKNECSSFEFIFVPEDGNRYVYGFSADQQKIYKEYLYIYKSRRPAMIFERKNVSNYEYTLKEKKVLEPLEKRNTDNKLFLATATAWNAESTKIPFQWLAGQLDAFTEAADMSGFAIEKYKGNDSKKYLEFTEKLLLQADINISHIHVDIKQIPIDEALRGFLPGVMINGQLIQPQMQEQIEVYTDHEIIDENKNVLIYKLGLSEESLGTSQLFYLGPVLLAAFETGKTVVIDEIDKSLHTAIVKYIIQMFHNTEVNKKGAQLIFTTHDTSLLSLERFRRDQVYFTEKNHETGISELYSLGQYSVRKHENIEKGYLLGRYGAIPFIRGEEFV